MSNPFEEISQKLDAVLQRLVALEKSDAEPKHISFNDFCKQENISRPTAYAWAEKGLIRLEKIGGRQFIPVDSIRVTRKFQRNLVEA